MAVRVPAAPLLSRPVYVLHRLMRVFLPVLLLLLLGLLGIGLAVWFAEPKVTIVEVDTSAVSGAEGSGTIGHGLDVEPRDLAAAEALWDEEECSAARARLEGALSGGPEDGASLTASRVPRFRDARRAAKKVLPKSSAPGCRCCSSAEASSSGLQMI